MQCLRGQETRIAKDMIKSVVLLEEYLAKGYFVYGKALILQVRTT
jgi:hypothetical protein